MSLRTRRGLALMAASLFVAAACTTTPPEATPTPGDGATPPPAVETPTPAPGDTPAPPADTPTPDTGGLDPDQTLRLYLSSDDPPSLDPHFATDSVSISVLNAVHRGLLYWDENLNVVPSLATDLPEVTDEGQTMTFTLRDDAVYSDGTPIVAGDLVYGWRRMVDPRLGNEYAYIFCYVEGVPEVHPDCGTLDDAPADDQIDGLLEQLGVEAPDDHTFIIRLNQPATFFQSVVAMWQSVPIRQDWVESAPFDSADNYLSSGPYIMTRWDHNSLIVLEPNPNWYGEPATATIELNIGGDPDAALARYEQGDFDMITVPGPQRRRIQDDPQYAEQVRLEAQLVVDYYDFANCGEPDDPEGHAERCPSSDATSDGRSPSANKNFRIALTQAVDKQRLIDLIMGGTGTVANSIVMPGLPGYDEEFNAYPFDPESAAQHMEMALSELGVEDNDGDGAVTAADLGTIRIGYNSDAGHLPIVTFLVEAWRTTFAMTEAQFDFIGVDFSTFLQQRRQGTYDISRNGWGADFPHPHNQLDLLVCNAGNNSSQYCSQAYNEAMNAAAVTQDQAQQEQMYIELQRTMMEDAPVLPLRHRESMYLIQPWVQGLSLTPNDHQNPGDVFYETIQISGRQ